MQAVGPAPAGHGAPRVLVDDDHLIALDDVLDVAAIDEMRAQRCVDVMQQRKIARRVQAVARVQHTGAHQSFFDLLVPSFEQFHLLVLFVDGEIAVVLALRLLPRRCFPGRQHRDQLVDTAIDLRGVFRRAGDDERRAGLIDQDRVDLVDNREVPRALHLVIGREGHVVAQVVETELVVRAIDDVACIGAALHLAVLARNHNPDGHAERAVYRRHPRGITTGEVVVHGDDVDALARERIEIHRQGCNEGLAFTRAHLRDVALVEGDAAEHLDVEVTHAERPPRSLANRSKGLRQNRVEAFAFGQARPKLNSEAREVRVGARFHGGFVLVDLAHDAAHAPQVSGVLVREDRSQQSSNHDAGPRA